MRLQSSSRPPPHLVWSFAGCVSAILILFAMGTADAAAAPAPARGAAAVSLAVPSPGDVSYAMVRVRLAPGQRLNMPSGLAGAVSIFSDRVGGLSIRARAVQWRALRATTHVYFVVTRAQGAPTDERDVALFVTRRTGHGGGAGGQVVFTVGNARAVVGSYWVHGVDRSGYANVFHARNIFATAIANWSRYTLALKLADAVRAAQHPRVRPVGPAASAHVARAAATRAAGRAPTSGPWTGGQPADARVKAMYQLLLGALHGPIAWGAFKGSPAVPSFIADELHDPSLANRWRTVVAKVPVTVPDKYAALAQEEKRFAHVTAPRLDHRMVAIDDPSNSSTQTEADASTADVQDLTVNDPDATAEYGGTVQISNLSSSDDNQTCDVTQCSFPYPVGSAPVSLEVFPDAGRDAALLSFDTDSCTPVALENFGVCTVSLDGTSEAIVDQFAESAPLNITMAPWGTIYDQTRPFNCDGSQLPCVEDLAVGSKVTFTAAIDGTVPSSWTGCDQSSGANCTVTINGPDPPDVTAHLDYPLTVALQGPTGSGGTVTSASGPIASGPINCGEVVTPSCNSSVEAGQPVVLTAAADAQSTFSSWSGSACAGVSGPTCTVTMSQAETVVANFVLKPTTSTTTTTSAPYSLTVNLTDNPSMPTRTGHVVSSPAGIDCESAPGGATTTCDANFNAGSSVTLTATPNTGVFEAWSGACAGVFGDTCTISMGADETVGAQFG